MATTKIAFSMPFKSVQYCIQERVHVEVMPPLAHAVNKIFFKVWHVKMWLLSYITTAMQ